jgi:hypothetical protein
MRRVADLGTECGIELLDVLREVAARRGDETNAWLDPASKAKYLSIDEGRFVLHEKAATTDREDAPHS